MADAERRYAKVIVALTQRWSDTLTFRNLAELGMEPAENFRQAVQLCEEAAFGFDVLFQHVNSRLREVLDLRISNQDRINHSRWN